MPATSELDTLSRLLLDVHRAGDEQGVAQVQPWILERLKQDLPFDSALWCRLAMTPGGPVLHAMHLHGQPAQMMVDYESVKGHDTLAVQAIAQLGVPVRAEAAEAPPPIRPYLRRWGLLQGLCTMQIDATSALAYSVSLYRRDAKRRYSERDVALMQAVFPHLRAADDRCKLHHLRQVAEDRATSLGKGSLAACDAKGMLHHASASFTEALIRQWPGWRGPWLPAQVLPLVAAAGGEIAVGEDQVLRCAPLADLRLLHLRSRSALDRLPPRLREVARLAAEGSTHRQIGERLGIAPATVRNHLSHIYTRLRLRSKAALAACVHGQDAAG